MGTFLLLVGAVVFFGYRLLGEEHRRALLRTLRPALIGGAMGIALGFLGPLVLSSGANEGPLLGILVTGPGGFALGLLFGVAREVVRRRAARAAVLSLVWGGMAATVGGLGAQVPGDPPAPGAPETLIRSETVTYVNPADSVHLTATLFLPGPETDDGAAGAAPEEGVDASRHPAVLLLTLAGPDPAVQALTASGYAVLVPIVRGFVSVEPLLRATHQDLAGDARAALAYLRSRPDLDGGSLAVVAQADEAPPAMLAAEAEDLPLILLAPPAFPGRQAFRLDQRTAGERGGYGPEELDALDRLTNGIADAVLEEPSPEQRAARLRGVLEASPVRLPYSAELPEDERQIHFLSSPLWHDRMGFEPGEALSRLPGPVLVLIGNEDPGTPLLDWLGAVRRGLEDAPSPDATVCLLPGRTRHVFSSAGVEAMGAWLGAGASGKGMECLEDPPSD